MLITQETMDKIHQVQLDMWGALSELLEKMEIQYFFIHGSLLGALTRKAFIEEDDDIDIAIFREDYERLMKEGNKYLPDYYLLQSCMNDDFPMPFGKFRDKRTLFSQPVLNKYSCNKGIYIDIFPIDYCIKDSRKAKYFKIREKLLSARICSRMRINKSFKSFLFRFVAYIIFPSYKIAVTKRERMFANCVKDEYITIINGKKGERKMPFRWFESTVQGSFCDYEVSLPVCYDEYLTAIYGADYILHNPAQNRLKNQEIEVSADYIKFADE